MPYCQPKAQREREGELVQEETMSSSAEQEAGVLLVGIEE
jgi:hypothetical protein